MPVGGSGMVSYMRFGFSPAFRPLGERQFPSVHTSVTSWATEHPGIHHVQGCAACDWDASSESLL